MNATEHGSGNRALPVGACAGEPLSARHALGVAALCWAGFAIVVVAVHGHVIDGEDAAGLTIWRRSDDLGAARGPTWLLEAMRDLTALGGPLLRNLFALGALAALLAIQARMRALRFGLTVIGGWLLDVLLKALVGRARPVIVPHLMDVTGHSFPSGHSFNAAVVYTAMALAFAWFTPRRCVRASLITVAVVTSLMVSLTRVWLGVHYPTDVIAGWLGGTGWAFLASATLPRIFGLDRQLPSTPDPHES